MREQSVEIQALFGHLQVLTSTVWTFYPVVVLLGRAQCHLISKDTEDAILCILDCIAKLGMEGLIVAWSKFIIANDGSGSSGSSGGH